MAGAGGLAEPGWPWFNSLVGGTPEELKQRIATEAARWRKVAQDNKAKLAQ